MKTHTIDLPELLDAFVAEQVASGEYRDAESVIVASLLKGKAEADVEAVKTERFLAKVQVGLDQFDRGEYTVVDDIDAYLDAMLAEVEAEFTAKDEAA